MRFTTLRVHGLRCLSNVDIELAPGMNLFAGANGAGKSSVLEAAYLLSHGRSFRRGRRDALIQDGAAALQVFGEVVSEQRARRRLGLSLQRGDSGWEARVDGAACPRLSDLVRLCAVLCFDPGVDTLVSGATEPRRRFMDWGLFHVEPTFLSQWQDYRRALQQRNALLRSATRPASELMDVWESQMDASGRRITEQRTRYLSALQKSLHEVPTDLVAELGGLSLRLYPGWDATQSLRDTLREQRDRDRERGYTGSGVHRADWRLLATGVGRKDYFSRGQAKLAALACHLAQTWLFRERRGEWPVLCIDDLAAELDARHRGLLLAYLESAGMQVWVTTTGDLAAARPSSRTFHVEHGTVTPA